MASPRAPSDWPALSKGLLWYTEDLKSRKINLIIRGSQHTTLEPLNSVINQRTVIRVPAIDSTLSTATPLQIRVAVQFGSRSIRLLKSLRLRTKSKEKVRRAPAALDSAQVLQVSEQLLSQGSYGVVSFPKCLSMHVVEHLVDTDSYCIHCLSRNTSVTSEGLKYFSSFKFQLLRWRSKLVREM